MVAATTLMVLAGPRSGRDVPCRTPSLAPQVVMYGLTHNRRAPVGKIGHDGTLGKRGVAALGNVGGEDGTVGGGELPPGIGGGGGFVGRNRRVGGVEGGTGCGQTVIR